MSGPPAGWVVLDVDDTLLDTVTNGFEKVGLAACAMGLDELSRDDFDAAYGATSFEGCVRRWFPGADVATFAYHYERAGAERPYSALCDGPELLAAITDSGLRPAVLTNGPAAKTERKLRVLGLRRDDFDVVLCGDEGPRKPSVAAFERLTGHGIDPERSWYVSDDRNDWHGAAGAGLRTLGVVNGRRRQHRLPGGPPVHPDAVVATSSSLARVVPHLRASLTTPAVRRAPEAVLFDAGFTLVTDRRTPDELVERALGGDGTPRADISLAMAGHRHLLDPSIWRSMADCERALRTFYEAVLRALGAPAGASAGALLDTYVAPRNWAALPGVEAVLERLVASGLRLSVFSNWQDSLTETIAAAGLGRFFDTCVTSVQLGIPKPAPEGFRKAARAAGADPVSAVYVGDDAGTDFAALTAGLAPVLVEPAAGGLLAAGLSAALDRDLT